MIRFGALVAGRWYVSERPEVPAYDTPAIGAKAGQWETQQLLVGRIAVRRLRTSHREFEMELGLMSPGGSVSMVPGGNSRIVNSAMPGQRWDGGFVKWRDDS